MSHGLSGVTAAAPRLMCFPLGKARRHRCEGRRCHRAPTPHANRGETSESDRARLRLLTPSSSPPGSFHEEHSPPDPRDGFQGLSRGLYRVSCTRLHQLFIAVRCSTTHADASLRGYLCNKCFRRGPWKNATRPYNSHAALLSSARSVTSAMATHARNGVILTPLTSGR